MNNWFITKFNCKLTKSEFVLELKNKSNSSGCKKQ